MRSASLYAAFVAASITFMAVAQQKAVDRTPARVFIGQSLDDAKAAMTRGKIGFSERGFALRLRNPDESHLSVSIDDRHASICVWYSISKSRVTDLAMVFRPHRQAVKTEQSWLPASELLLNEDRSYTVKFNPPLTEEENHKLEEKSPPHEVPPPIDRK